MMVNIGSIVVPVNIAFSSSKKAALIESKILHYTTISINLHHCALSEKKPKFLHWQTSLLVSEYIARIRNNTHIGTFYQNLLKIRCEAVLTWQMSICTPTIQA